MGWEQRGNNTYYYRKVRRNGRVVSEYLGRGKSAQLRALIDRAGKRLGEQARKATRAAHAEQEWSDQVLLEFAEMAQTIARGYLIAQGCHTHKGEWRRKREKGKSERPDIVTRRSPKPVEQTHAK